MKLLTTVILCLFVSIAIYGQSPLVLKIKEGSDKPNYEKEHSYLLEITNSSKKSTRFFVDSKNTKCQNLKEENQVELIQKNLNKASKSQFSEHILKPNESFEFYLKISRPANTTINKWNCTEVKAVDENGNTISNSVIITSLIPDPKDNN
ncbi:hypothetical protein [Winogradskyella sp. MH6]|jgi:hypothetical protein|uniref:hypothetical protein n=1 Tax=Winogradskyella sp. MH6 TaxID=2929510 RepID=UPI000C8F9FDF|nr:hypothetical protein [Winogradskyella sp. MH6]MAB47911.1 hypothetical protein [Flavobacteriaceae bacterium]|tara:strand:- start:2110 stop:2559 length:450 start_codon:yes stop_codon:yes gene_type:complete